MAESSKSKKNAFEAQLAQLEDIVQKLDAEDVALEEAIRHYETGVKLSLQLNQTLDAVQRKIELLTQTEDGEIQARPFGEDEAEPDGQ